jgi:hypothetical protein
MVVSCACEMDGVAIATAAAVASAVRRVRLFIGDSFAANDARQLAQVLTFRAS